MTTTAETIDTMTGPDYAEEAYKQQLQMILGRLMVLEDMVRRHDVKSGKVKHWGHVGDLSHVDKLLGDVEDFLS